MKQTKPLPDHWEQLKNYGFEPIHNMRFAIHLPDFKYIEVDFSAIDQRKYLEVAINAVYKSGIEKGREQIQKELKNILNIHEEQKIEE